MSLIQALAVTGYLSSFRIWFLLLLPMAVIPVLLEVLYSAKLWKKDFQKSAQYRKEESAYEQAMTDAAGCKETRLTGGAKRLLFKWRHCRKQRCALDERRSRKAFFLRTALLPVQLIGTTGGFLVSILLLYSKQIGLAEFAAGVAAYGALTATLQSLVGSLGDELQWRNMIEPFFWYWDIPHRTGETERIGFEKDIRLDHVSFRYAGRSDNAVADLSLTIKKGEIVAIVGENGAGKTTLVNLLLGLYLPTEGAVLYDGISTAKLKEPLLHRTQSAVMQNFSKYKLTVGDNIRIADFDKQDPVAQEVRRIFPDGSITEDTRLGREFGGRELSGGQWQQLSCARGFWKSNDFLVLDEATSAIDPLREKAMYDRFKQEMNGKTGILITHRLGAVSMADRILVLDHGRIVQDGVHEELLTQGGLYADLWNAQAGAYV